MDGLVSKELAVFGLFFLVAVPFLLALLISRELRGRPKGPSFEIIKSDMDSVRHDINESRNFLSEDKNVLPSWAIVQAEKRRK